MSAVAPIGYLAPDGTHHPCEAWEHKALARAICRALGLKREPIAEDDWRAPWHADLGDDVIDPEQELDRRGYVRVEHSAARDGAIQWAARCYDPAAVITEAQREWLGRHGFGRLLRDLLLMWDAPPDVIDAPEGGP